PVVAATARWLARSYPAPEPGAFSAALVELQARQAVTVAAWLRYPTEVDAELLTIAGPGGSARLDWVVGLDEEDLRGDEHAWRAWVDEVVASWAACLLTDGATALAAVQSLARATGATNLTARFRRLLDPDGQDGYAAALLRHPDLAAPVADLHRDLLTEHLDGVAAA
ncbi:MAG TPA: hypothetical protein VFT95_05405, partial [Micromonosporaceae bacterium]|nr:hypothetical protein [Micromonosporaceae bacterium]